MIALLLAALAGQGLAAEAAAARAESLLAAGKAQFARRVVGRYPALAAFRAAARLAPRDPEPLYWQMKVGLYLRGAEGDVIAREALLRLFALTPDYADAWERFQDVYRNPDVWRRAERALAVHGDDLTALERRAELCIALEDGRRADSLLALVMARRPGTARSYLLRAEAAFLDGGARDRAGYAWHDSALARADADSTGALWDAAWLIATPAESARHAATPPEGRRAFFERFWQRRDPNLVTPENERLPEHYARRAAGRRMYRLLHPQRSIYHSAKARALGVFGEHRELTDLAWNARALEDAALPAAVRAGLTAQGLVYLRHGPPDEQTACIPEPRVPHATPGCYSHLDVEGWLYWTADGPMSLGFRRGGEFFAPVSRDQVRSIGTLLRTDRSALPAPLEARAWVAFYQSAELGLTDAYYKAAGAAGAAAAVVLWDATGEPVRAAGAGMLVLSVPPGRYQLGLDVDSAGVLGRVRRETTVPRFSMVDLNLSSLALAPLAPAAAVMDREAVLDGMPADLAYPAGAPLAAYVEIYGLTTDRDGRSQYRVRYSFEPVRSVAARLLRGSSRPVVFEFERQAPGSSAIERLVIEPDKVPAGRYRVAVAVTDARRNVKSESVALDITIR